jgi:hypothetical protein
MNKESMTMEKFIEWTNYYVRLRAINAGIIPYELLFDPSIDWESTTSDHPSPPERPTP